MRPSARPQTDAGARLAAGVAPCYDDRSLILRGTGTYSPVGWRLRGCGYKASIRAIISGISVVIGKPKDAALTTVI